MLITAVVEFDCYPCKHQKTNTWKYEYERAVDVD